MMSISPFEEWKHCWRTNKKERFIKIVSNQFTVDRRALAHLKIENRIALKKTRIFQNFNCTTFSKCIPF